MIRARVFKGTEFAERNGFCSSSKQPRVLMLRLKKNGTVGWGGVAAHTLFLYKNLLQAGVKAYILIPANSVPEQHFKEQNLPYFTFKDGVSFEAGLADGDGDSYSMYKKALDLCKKYKINIIHANFGKEVAVAKKICSALKKTQKVDVEDIALQIKYLIENPVIAKNLDNAAYNMVSDYYLSNWLTLEYIKIYKKILEENEKISYVTKQ